MVHITGGGFGGNIPRVVPSDLQAVIRKGSWNIFPVFPLIAEMGNVPEDEMYSTFNMGLGFLLFVSPDIADEVTNQLTSAGETVYNVGTVVMRTDEDPVAFV